MLIVIQSSAILHSKPECLLEQYESWYCSDSKSRLANSAWAIVDHLWLDCKCLFWVFLLGWRFNARLLPVVTFTSHGFLQISF